MADLLTHVLVPYICVTVARWFLTIPRQWTPVAMGGAIVPDLVKVDLLLDDDTIGSLLELPFSYAPLGSITGVVLVSGIVALAFRDKDRLTAYGFLVLGGVSSLVLDGLRAFADGSAGYWLYPLWVRPPTPSLYVTSDVRVTVVALSVASVVGLVDRWISS